jgi:hypothetical protein
MSDSTSQQLRASPQMFLEVYPAWTEYQRTNHDTFVPLLHKNAAVIQDACLLYRPLMPFHSTFVVGNSNPSRVLDRLFPYPSAFTYFAKYGDCQFLHPLTPGADWKNDRFPEVTHMPQTQIGLNNAFMTLSPAAQHYGVSLSLQSAAYTRESIGRYGEFTLIGTLCAIPVTTLLCIPFAAYSLARGRGLGFVTNKLVSTQKDPYTISKYQPRPVATFKGKMAMALGGAWLMVTGWTKHAAREANEFTESLAITMQTQEPHSDTFIRYLEGGIEFQRAQCMAIDKWALKYPNRVTSGAAYVWNRLCGSISPSHRIQDLEQKLVAATSQEL